MKKRFQTMTALVLSLAVVYSVAGAPSAEPKKPPLAAVTDASVESRIGNLTNLIKSSSGADRVEQSGNPDALAHKRKAEERLQAAIGLHEAGRLDQANATLDEATREMFEAVRIAGAGRQKVDKQAADFEQRKRSVEVLVDALERISQEKGEGASVAATVEAVKRDVNQAVALKEGGDLAGGRKELDRAYVRAKEEIESLRGGDTLVRSLEFESKEEEYHYEIDRNDTHKMLVKVLLEERMKQPSVSKQVNQFLDKSRQLREKAESEAGRGDFDKAVETLEASTRELVRAIRSAGVYIPG